MCIAKRRRWLQAATAAVAMMLVGPVLAQLAPADPLIIALTLKRVEVAANGKETLVDAPAVKPNDLVEYKAVYTNRGAKPLTNVAVTLPLPRGIDYQGQSGRPAGFQASTDGSTFAPEPLVRTVTREGKLVTVPVPYSEYRAVRWQVRQIEAGKSIEVAARGKVSSTPPAPLAAGVPAPGAR